MTDLIIKGPAMIPGQIDLQNDRPLTPQEIQKAAYQFLPGSPIVDVQHAFKKIADVVESYIAPEDTVFNDKTYPAGTWFLSSKVTDPQVQQGIRNGELKGYSVAALPEKQYQDLKRVIPDNIVSKALFKNVDEGAWFPLTVSIVDIPAVPDAIFKIFEPDDVIKKSKGDVNQMTEENAIVGMFSKLLDHVITKSDNKKDDNYSSKLEDRVKELKDKNTEYEDKLEKLNKKFDKLNNKLKAKEEDKDEDKKEDEKEDKEDKSKDDKKKDNDKQDSKDDKKDDKSEDKTEDTTDVTDTAITKSIPIDSTTTTGKKSLMEKIGADPFGRNKKYL